jgi:transcription elongation factor Elf1
MLIPLVCTKCGGKLEVENSQVFESGDTVIVLADQTFKCPHCGTKYLPGEKIKHVSGATVISISGSVTASNIIIGNGTVINKSPNPASFKESQDAKPPKKWWQFWKK